MTQQLNKVENLANKKEESTQIWKKEMKLSLFTDNMIIYMENQEKKQKQKNFLELKVIKIA